ncbi:hypothetical protein C2S52_022106 [Perilla frutescens var. hirtella]|nr:hypothetical protein C2S52_022106 [Perilla frutescens var. hirtella]KAH6807491.1 hypothetical protein C2S51_028599 [Perilla frutescens var. frutescens]
MDDESVEVPEHFICPISLQIMKDPVTATSGITYDRDSIEQWLFRNNNTICPVTKHPLPEPATLTPNHTLRRLINAWSPSAAIPTPKTPLTKFYVTDLVRNLRDPGSQLQKLRNLAALAAESERNRVYMAEAELATTLISFVVACRHRKCATDGLEEALSILHMINLVQSKGASLSYVNDEIIDSLVWVLDLDRDGDGDGDDDISMRSHAACALKAVVEKAKPAIMERLKPELFQSVSRNLRGGLVSEQGTKALLKVLLEACPWGRNRVMMVEAGTVRDLVEVELRCPREKKTSEMVLGIMYKLCTNADGRAQLLSHAAGMAVVTWRILKVSAAADDMAVLIIWEISKYSATNGVVQEMLRVGTVGNLCLLMLADTASHVKDKARNILRMHFNSWKDSPCIEMATLTRYST